MNNKNKASKLNRIILISLAGISLGFGSGCATNRTGASDYRLIGKENAIDKSFKYLATDNKDATIPAEESVYITLTHGFIKEFWEANAVREVFDLSKYHKEGEIAIIARVHELGTGADFDFSSAGSKAGRIVFYDEGVHVKSHLNFSNIPIYGPITYKGRPLAISFYVKEVDYLSDQKMGSLFKTLSSIGMTAYPPSSPVLKVLDSVGSSFLTEESGDDLELSYHFVLDPSVTEAGNPAYARLLSGNYVLIKRDPEDESVQKGHPVDWNKVHLDADTGVLYEDASKTKPYTDATYLVFQIRKGLDPTGLDLAERSEQYSDFIKRNSSGSMANFNTALAEVTQVFGKQAAASQAKKVIKDLEKLKGKTDTTALTDQKNLLNELLSYFNASSGDVQKGLNDADKTALINRVGKIVDPQRQSFTLADVTAQAANPKTLP